MEKTIDVLVNVAFVRKEILIKAGETLTISETEYQNLLKKNIKLTPKKVDGGK